MNSHFKVGDRIVMEHATFPRGSIAVVGLRGTVVEIDEDNSNVLFVTLDDGRCFATNKNSVRRIE